jgi:hypothetical protein
MKKKRQFSIRFLDLAKHSWKMKAEWVYIQGSRDDKVLTYRLIWALRKELEKPYNRDRIRFWDGAPKVKSIRREGRYLIILANLGMLHPSVLVAEPVCECQDVEIMVGGTRE